MGNMKQGVLFRTGILFTAGSHKGKTLFKLLDQLNTVPQKIVFVNDKKSHLRAIEETAEERGIPFIGLRYAYSDARKAAYQHEVADYQFRHSSFARLLSDEEALQGLK
jgi:hypothetical protein